MTVQVGLCRTWSETPKTGFLASQLIYSLPNIPLSSSWIHNLMLLWSEMMGRSSSILNSGSVQMQYSAKNIYTKLIILFENGPEKVKSQIVKILLLRIQLVSSKKQAILLYSAHFFHCKKTIRHWVDVRSISMKSDLPSHCSLST